MLLGRDQKLKEIFFNVPVIQRQITQTSSHAGFSSKTYKKSLKWNWGAHCIALKFCPIFYS